MWKRYVWPFLLRKSRDRRTTAEETEKRQNNKLKYTCFKLSEAKMSQLFHMNRLYQECQVQGIFATRSISQACGRKDRSITALLDEFTWGFQTLLSTVLMLEATTQHLALAAKLKPICIPWIHHTAFIYSSDALCTWVQIGAFLSTGITDVPTRLVLVRKLAGVRALLCGHGLSILSTRR